MWYFINWQKFKIKVCLFKSMCLTLCACVFFLGMPIRNIFAQTGSVASIRGTVRLFRGGWDASPVKNGIVKVFNADLTTCYAETSTSAKGFYEIKNLPIGKDLVVVTYHKNVPEPFIGYERILLAKEGIKKVNLNIDVTGFPASGIYTWEKFGSLLGMKQLENLREKAESMEVSSTTAVSSSGINWWLWIGLAAAGVVAAAAADDSSSGGGGGGSSGSGGGGGGSSSSGGSTTQPKITSANASVANVTTYLTWYRGDVSITAYVSNYSHVNRLTVTFCRQNYNLIHQGGGQYTLSETNVEFIKDWINGQYEGIMQLHNLQDAIVDDYLIDFY